MGARCACRILATAGERFQAAYIAKQLMSNLASFKASKKLISDGPNLFYVFPDISTVGLPTTLEQAFDEGYLVITCVDVGRYSLQIANEQYVGAFDGLALILFDWASSEGYIWAPLPRVSLPGEPQPIRYRRTASGYRIAWDEPGENF